MKIEFREEPVERAETPLLIVWGFEGSPVSSGTAEQLPAATRKLLDGLHASGELTGKTLECTLIHNPPGLAARRLLVVGAGKREKSLPHYVMRLAGAAVRFARGRGIHEAAWLCDGSHLAADALQLITEGALLADYDPDRYRSDRNSTRRIDRLNLLLPGGKAGKAENSAIERGRVVGESANFTRDLVNEPSNIMTPTRLADEAAAMASQFGLQSEILGPDAIRALKMNAFLAVAQGSSEPPRLIVLRYTPADAPASPVVALVGKGITFDTGGISIKPAANMEEMKTDMAGGAA
ncbi:MAG: leucyl aminopeptidase family protein, partial [Terriglobia bacterium]